MNTPASASSAGYALTAGLVGGYASASKAIIAARMPLAGGVIGVNRGVNRGVHLGLHSVFFVTAARLVACAGLAQWARGR